MATPRAPRKAIGNVDVQLEEFETDLRGLLEYQLSLRVDRDFWDDHLQLSEADNQLTDAVIDGAFTDLLYRYENSEDVVFILNHCRILIQNVVWAAMNVPIHGAYGHTWVDDHIKAVINNAMAVYNRVIYAPLRTEMIMANHNAQVLQRTWRRCISDPAYLACRRRLMYEFDQVQKSLRDPV